MTCETECETTCETNCQSSCATQSDTHAKMAIRIANRAWTDTLHDKMKAEYQKQMGAKLDAIAKAAVEANIAYWEGKLASKQQWDEYQAKINKAMAS